MTDGNAADDPPGTAGAPPPPPTVNDRNRNEASSDPPKETLEEQVRALINERGYAPETARQIATTWKCEQCECALGVPRKDDCMCRCHCECCCVGLFRCCIGCDCDCPEDCHYDANGSITSEHESDNEQGRTKDEMQEGTTQAAEGSTGARTTDADGDVTMQPKDAMTVRQWPLSRLFEKISGILNSEMYDEDANRDADQYAQAFFGKLYAEAIQNGMKPKENSTLPSMTIDERALLMELMRVLNVKQVSLQKFTAAISDVVRTSFRSTWALDRILIDRAKTASAPPAVGPNAWGQKMPNAKQATLAADMGMYRFDRNVFSETEIARLKKLCEERHPFATATRKATTDEWTIMMGIMSGAIAARVAPEFMKRCCNLMQFQYVFYQTRVRAEGELYVKLPTQAKLYDFNQTSKRISDAIMAAVEYQKLDGRPVREMLAAAKSLSYNDDLKTIHIFFDSKADAVRWEGTQLPFRSFKVPLQNPDARYREIHETADGERKVVLRAPRDGLEDNRYDTNYRLLLGNVTPTMDIDKLAKFLDDLTGGAIKMGAPTDSYGANSEHSLIWLFLAHTSECPAALRGVNRILWKGHAIMITHPGRAGAAPCHQCAEIGHQMSACPKTNPADWISSTTIVVTAAMIDAIQTVRKTWKTPEEALQLFEGLGDHPSTAQATTSVVARSTDPVVGTIPDTTAEATSTAPTIQSNDTPPTNEAQAMSDGATANSSIRISKSTPTGATEITTTGPKAQANRNAPAQQAATPDSNGWFTAMSRMATNRAKRNQQADGSTSTNVNNGTKVGEMKQFQSKPGTTTTTPSTGQQGNGNKKLNRGDEAGKERNNSDSNEEQKDEDEDDNSHESGDANDEGSRTEDGRNEDADPGSDNETTDREQQEHGLGEQKQTSETDHGERPRDNRANGKQTTGSTKGKNQPTRQQLPHREDDDALDAAIDRSNMERIGLTILRLAQRHRPILHKEACLAALKKARSAPTRRQSSQKGTLEAINGTMVHTPPTGNCLYAAITESLIQLAFVANKQRDTMIELMMLLKFLLYLANRVDPDVELNQTNATALLEMPAGEVEGLSTTELMVKISEYYAKVATSSSELNHILPEALWGRTDCIRLLAKALRRSIYVIIQSEDPDVVHHMIFQPQRIKDHTTKTTVASATINQPGYQEWLGMIQQEIENDITPIVISHNNDHYNAVLLHHDVELTQRKVPTKETTLTKLWGPALVSTDRVTGKPPAGATMTMAAEDGMTLAEMISSQSSVHPPEIFRALSQENWNRQEKKAAIEALVHGQDRIKELLAFCDANPASTPSSSEAECKDEDMDADSADGSNAAYVPSQSSESSEEVSSSEDTDTAMVGESQSSVGSQYAAYSLPYPTDTQYDVWAQTAWGRIVDEWAGQDGAEPPRLAERAKLAKFAKDYPDVMAELGRNHPNPTVVLEHLADKDIKGWCAAKRIRYVVEELTHIIATIDSEPARQVLMEWRLEVQAGTDVEIQTQRYRDSTKWAILKAHAAARLAERPLLTRDYTKECASVLALDELFPDLATDIFQAHGMPHDDSVGLIQAYESVPAFRTAVRSVKDKKKWMPIVKYIRGLGIHLSQPSTPSVTQY